LLTANICPLLPRLTIVKLCDVVGSTGTETSYEDSVSICFLLLPGTRHCTCTVPSIGLLVLIIDTFESLMISQSTQIAAGLPLT
jgi:hypothetical protein